MIPDNQTEHATRLLETQVTPEDHATHTLPDAPQTPFPTSLILDREQEDRMVKFAVDYIQRLSHEMGREIRPTGSIFAPDLNTHFGKRETFTMRYYNHVEDRPARDPRGIYGVSNITATLSQRTTMQMIARANNYFFGTEPWYSCDFVGVEDKAKAQKVDRHSKWKFGITGLARVMSEATEFAFIRGEAVVKTTYATRDRHFKRKGKALVDAMTGSIVVDAKGNPVFIGDKFEPLMQQGVDPATGQPVAIPTAQQVLKRDGKTPLPQQVAEQPGIFDMKQRLFEGPEAKLVFYKDFLCSLAAQNIHEAELICHLYDMPVMTLVQTFKRLDLAAQGAKDGFASLKKAVDAIRNLSAGSGGIDPTSAALQPRGDFKEQGNQASQDNPYAEVAEVYMTYDADGDGIPEEIMMVLDMKNRFPLFYDYLDNVTPKGRRPFEVVRSKSVDGRWYGMGAMEYFAPEQEFIDLQVNRKNFRQSKAGRVTFWNPSVTREGQTQPNLTLNDGGTYTLREGFKGEDALSYVTLPEDGADLMELVNFFNQLMQLKSGIINAGDQQSSGMDTGDTATGINNVERSGHELFATFLSALEPGHQAILLSQIQILYAYISEPEMFRFFDTQANAMMTDTIDPEDVAEMEYDVRVLLTRVRTEQVLKMSAEARALIEEFYLKYGPFPQTQKIIAPMFRDSLKALGYNNADDLIVAQPMPLPGMDPATGQPIEPEPATEEQEPPPLI